MNIEHATKNASCNITVIATQTSSMHGNSPVIDTLPSIITSIQHAMPCLYTELFYTKTTICFSTFNLKNMFL